MENFTFCVFSKYFSVTTKAIKFIKFVRMDFVFTLKIRNQFGVGVRGWSLSVFYDSIHMATNRFISKTALVLT